MESNNQHNEETQVALIVNEDTEILKQFKNIYTEEDNF